MTDPLTKVLLIDDDATDVELIRTYLSEESDVPIEIEHVDRFSAGRERLVNGCFEAVLLDIGAPDSKGLETFRRAFQHCPTVPIIVLTDTHAMDQALEVIREGAADCLLKGQIDGPLLIRSIRFANERAARGGAGASFTETAALYRDLVETTGDWIWEVDRESVYKYCSPKVKDLLGYEPEEVVGRTLSDFVLPSEAERFTASIQESMDSGAPVMRLDHTSLHKDGRHVVLETNAVPVLDREGQVLAYRGIDRDITEVKEALDLLCERERRYRQLLAAVTNYAYSVQIESGASVSTEHGEGCMSVTGYRPEDYESNPDLWIAMIHPDDREAVGHHVEKVLCSEDVPPLEHRIYRCDGTTRWVRNTIIPHRESGVVVRYDGLIEDITERKNAEQTLRDRELQLLMAQKIQERLLPDAAPTLPGFDIAGTLYPAEFAAGDYYDYLPMGDGEMGIAIGDVTGHGFGPALIMASTHVMLRLLVETHKDVGRILSLANSKLTSETTDDRFVTLLFARLDPKTRTLVYSNAGHPPGYVFDSTGNIRSRLDSMNAPLGIEPEVEFTVSDPLPLEPGDTVLLLSDGILESLSPEEEFYGYERALETVRNNIHRSAREIVESLCQSARGFSENEAALDDTTAVVIKAQPAGTAS